MTGAPNSREIAWNPESGDDLGDILDQIVALVRRFVVLTLDQAHTVALWVVHTHAIDAAEMTPYLAIGSATWRAGKTRLLEVLAQLVHTVWFTDRVSAAVLVRKIDKESPTLLLDEVDAALKVESDYSEALRGLLNSGYRRGGTASMCVGQGSAIGYKDFTTFCPKAIAGIGALPDTVRDRSIPIVLRRRLMTEPVARWHERDVLAEVGPLKVRVAQWAAGSIAALREARPDLPPELGDRAQDVWEPLLAIAEAAGPVWAAQARTAARALSGTADARDILTELLQDIADLLYPPDPSDDTVAPLAVDGIVGAKVLLDALIGLEGRPWAEWRRGQPMTTRGLARLLGPLEIVPARHTTLAGRQRGYRCDVFEEAFSRYIPIHVSKRPPFNKTGAEPLHAKCPPAAGRDTCKTVVAPVITGDGTHGHLEPHSASGDPASPLPDNDQPAVAVLRDLEAAGLDISVDGDRLRVEPDDRLTADQTRDIQKHGSALVALARACGADDSGSLGSPVLPGTEIVHTDAREGTDDRLT